MGAFNVFISSAAIVAFGLAGCADMGGILPVAPLLPTGEVILFPSFQSGPEQSLVYKPDNSLQKWRVWPGRAEYFRQAVEERYQNADA